MPRIFNHVEYLNAIQSICCSLCLDWKHNRHFIVAQSNADIDGIEFCLTNARDAFSYMTAQAINLQASEVIEELAVACDCQNSLFVHLCKSLGQESSNWKRSEIQSFGEFAIERLK